MRKATYRFATIAVLLLITFGAVSSAYPILADNNATIVLVDNSTTGYYNNALGTVLDGTQLLFPAANSFGGKDPTIPRAPEPNLSPAATILGNWLSSNPLPLNNNWSALQPIPKSWSASLENAIIYPISVGPEGLSQVIGNFGVDNGLFVWVNGRYKFGAMAPGPVGGFEYANVNLGSLPPGTNYIQILREDHGGIDGFTILITGSAGAASGRITFPPENFTYDPAVLPIRAEAWSNTGLGVKHVEFYVFYDHSWHAAGLDANAPYEVQWLAPNNLRSQILKIRIDVVDNSGSRTHYADVVSGVDYREYVAYPGVTTNWVPFRVYLNQRVLDTPGKDGDIKCSAASMSMILAMNSVIDWDFLTLKNKAIAMYPKVLNANGDAYPGGIVKELKNQGMSAVESWQAVDSAWSLLKQQIDGGYPAIVRTAHGVVTRDGHYIVAVGYRETPELREIITYDPFGEWKGSCCGGNSDYDKNDSTDSESQKGKWVYYNFNKAFGGFNALITAQPKSNYSNLVRAMTIPSTLPDLMSDEPEDLGAYLGVPDIDTSSIYIPLVIHK